MKTFSLFERYKYDFTSQMKCELKPLYVSILYLESHYSYINIKISILFFTIVSIVLIKKLREGWYLIF